MTHIKIKTMKTVFDFVAITYLYNETKNNVL